MKRLTYIIYVFVMAVCAACSEQDLDGVFSSLDSYYVNVASADINAGFEGGVESIDINTNMEWRAETKDSWVRLISSQGASSGKLELELKPNNTYDTRTGSVSVYCMGALKKTIKISQEGVIFKIDDGDLVFDSSSSSKTIEINTNGSWKITSDAFWIHFSSEEGVGNTSVVVTVDARMSVYDRSATIKITDELGKTRKINVTQQGKYLRVDKTSIFFPTSGGENSITIETDGEPVFDFNDWLSCQYSNNKLNIRATSNNSTNSRKGYITISLRGVSDLVPVNIEVSQQAKDKPIDDRAVDLGLSVKWASCNVGANAPEDYGDYFAWGETTGKSSYTTDNSQWYGVSYTDLQSRGVIDSNGNLLPQYDAARQNWGGSWRMPTLDEIKELIDRCTWTWTSVGGHNGYRVTGPNGNTIFLTAAGSRGSSGLGGAGSRGYYWSATARSSADGAYDLYFSSSDRSSYCVSRYIGRSIRPVTE